jgi:shikimate dehydrogenase
MPKLAVIGHPVAHSRSPAMHAAAFEAMGIADEWSYEAIDVSADEFQSRVRALVADGFAGVNVTVPHKLAALELADRVTPAARAIGAANMLSFSDRGIEAENTDAPGLLGALGVSPAGERATVLGAGGAARACVWALVETGAEVSVWNRTQGKAEELAASLGASVAQGAGHPLGADTYDILVNATTVGHDVASGERTGSPEPLADLKALPVDADSVSARHVVVDLVYGSSETPLSALARERGADVVDGLEVLVHQGAASFRLWTGLDPPIDVMRDAARKT